MIKLCRLLSKRAIMNYSKWIIENQHETKLIDYVLDVYGTKIENYVIGKHFMCGPNIVVNGKGWILKKVDFQIYW